ncbi:beta-1,3-galactosyltransferase 5-like [Penaeus indicus]|uniref:beta-1,3-galactosyltransferase 5-like n=1 Tax=Penaeus indicus TaxID=29960 RepID=UPI00300D6B6D
MSGILLTTRNRIQREVQWHHAPASPSCSPQVTVIAFVTSSPDHRERRDRIRNTWANPVYYPRKDLRFLFVIGAIASTSVQAAVDEEMAQFNDIIQNNFYDSYRNLTYKTIAWLSWVVHHCPDVPFALKVDDDVVVNPFGLQELYGKINQMTISERKEGKPAVGKIYGRIILAPPQRVGRWALTKMNKGKKSGAMDFLSRLAYEEEYASNAFPPYAIGAAYIIDNVALRKLWDHVSLAPFLWIEDVFLTGMVAREAELKHEWLNHHYLERELSDSWYNGNGIFLLEASSRDAQTAWDFINK